MNTEELVKKLTAKFGKIDRIIIDVAEKHENEDDTITIAGVLVVLTQDNKVLCGMEVIGMKCSFLNGIYSSLPFGLVIHMAITNHPVIYAFDSTDVGISYLNVPCEFGDVNIDKFTIVGKVGEPCPYRNTEKCPLYRYKAQDQLYRYKAQNQQKDEKSRIPIII